MKCQYHAVISTAIRRASTGLCSKEALDAHINAIIPPAKCTACAIVNRYANELLGFVDIRNPRVCSSPHASHCPMRNAKPRTTVMPSHGKFFSSPREIPGIELTGANAACRAAFRRANSIVILLIPRITVLIASSTQGKLTLPQSRT